MHKCLPRDAIHSAVFAVVRCPSVCHVDVSKRPILLSNFFIAWWLHHSSFPKGDPTEIPTGSPSTGAPNRGGYTKNFRFSTSISEYTDTEYRGISKYRYRTDMKKIPTKIQNTDTDSKYRYRPSSSLQQTVYPYKWLPIAAGQVQTS